MAGMGSTIGVGWRRAWAKRSLQEVYTSVDNSFGFLRFLFAAAVLVSHTFPVGFGRADPVEAWTGGQTEVGGLSVAGFFVISGFLITRSGRRLRPGRFLWHRGLRILPAFWTCLLITAFVLAPIVALIERGSLANFWGQPDGPLHYVVRNWFIAIRQYDISGLLHSNPYARYSGGSGAFDGSLWSLTFEVMCYFMVAAFAVVGILKRARWAVLALGAAGLVMTIYDLSHAANIPGPQGSHGPVLGIHGLDRHDLLYLTYVFLLGALLELFRDRIRLNDGLAALAAVVTVVTLRFGAFDALGYPAFAYLVVWLAVRLPVWLRGVGRKHDYSYGFYIYAFPVQQILALVGVPRLGIVAYIALCAVGTLALAVPSWHLIERPAMSWKNRTVPDWLRQRLVRAAGRPAQHGLGQAAGPIAARPVMAGAATRADPGRHRPDRAEREPQRNGQSPVGGDADEPLDGGRPGLGDDERNRSIVGRRSPGEVRSHADGTDG